LFFEGRLFKATELPPHYLATLFANCLPEFILAGWLLGLTAKRTCLSDPRILVPNGNGKKFKVSFGRFRADIRDERWNLEGFGFDEA